MTEQMQETVRVEASNGLKKYLTTVAASLTIVMIVQTFALVYFLGQSSQRQAHLDEKLRDMVVEVKANTSRIHNLEVQVGPRP